MNRRTFLKTSLATLAVTATSNAAPAKASRPNILFCISDDQSWCHTTIAGDPVVKTPHFDRVAKEGILFNNAFTACPSCAPSRAAILTGQDFWRLEEGGLLFGRLNKKFPVYPKRLEDNGYHVGMTGKGYAPANQELDTVWKGPCGKEWYTDLPEDPPEEISSNDYATSFERFLDARPNDTPFCFWYGCYEPHRDYDYGIGAKSGMNLDDIEVPAFFPDADEVRNDIADYLFEIEWFDQHLGRMLKTLEEKGELDNTLIVVTSDNGMPFPRAKATAYNYGVHMPLAIRWGNHIKNPGRTQDDCVNHIDFAPTFLEAAGLDVPKQMTGVSLLPLLTNDAGPTRDFTVTGLERHVWTRPDGMPYPRRAIHTKDFAYIRNYEPDRWPMGGPDFVPSHQDTFGDIDAGPTKSYMKEHRDNPDVKDNFAKSFGKLPPEELYAINTDPQQRHNLAEDPAHQDTKNTLRQQMEDYLRKTKDPRVEGKSPWDDYPFYADEQYVRGKYREELERHERASEED